MSNSRIVIAIALIMVLIPGCNGKPEGEDGSRRFELDPDPGNRRYEALTKEQVRRLVPPGTVLKSEVIRRKKLGEAFTDFGEGPSLTRIFSRSDPAQQFEALFDWFEPRLVEQGWKRSRNEEKGYFSNARIFYKTIQNWCARLVLSETSEFGTPTGNLSISISSGASLTPTAHLPCEAETALP